MSSAEPPTSARTVTAALLPLVAGGLQAAFWPVISPFVWFLFYPVVFFSSWLGGLGAGLASTVLSVALVWWFFLEPVHVFLKPRPGVYLNAAMFLVMGALFSCFHELLRQAEHKASQRELSAKDDLLNRVSRLAKVGGWAFEVSTLKGTWTGEVARIHDLPEDTLPDVASGLQYYHERDRPLIAEAVRRVIEEGRPYDLELELVSAKGISKWVRTQGEPVRERGRVVKVQGTLQDITERKVIELELQRLNATLERRVEARTVELEAANHELEAFAYAVSHDLRAPLRAMGGFSQALLEDCAGALDDTGRGHLNQIIQASSRMGGLIDGLLQLSRATRGNVQRLPVDLSALSASILEDLARGEGRTVRWAIEPGLRVQGDPRMLEAVLGNLLGNAWKYTAKVADPSIEVGAVLDEGLRWVRIRDNGCGFDMAHAAKLFQPFQRLHRQDEYPGLGIGLATVDRIIQRHGGRLKATAAPGLGATFQLYLPAAPELP